MSEFTTARIRTARIGVGIAFLILGVVSAEFATRVPALKAHTHLSDGGLGLALLALPFGSLAASTFVGRVVERLGSATVTRVSTLLTCFVPVPLAFASNGWQLGAGLFLFGLIAGALDMSMNTHGVTVERLYERPIMASFHAIFSIGAGVGAAVSALLIGLDLSPLSHFVTMGFLLLASSTVVWRYLLPSSHDLVPRDEKQDRAWNRQLVVLGILILLAFACEGSAVDWSAVHLEEVGASHGIAALAYTFFTASMCLMRTVGDRMSLAFGRTRVVGVGALVSAICLLIGLSSTHPVVALAGWLAFGSGVALVAPTTFALAGNLRSPSSGIAISRVAGFGYVGFISSPALIGGIASVVDLRVALLLPVFCSAVIGVIAMRMH